MVFANIPAPSDMITNIGAVSSPWFDAWLPLAYWIIGVPLAALIIVALYTWIIEGVSMLGSRHSKYD